MTHALFAHPSANDAPDRVPAARPSTGHSHGPVPNPLPRLLSGGDLGEAEAEHLFERLVLGASPTARRDTGRARRPAPATTTAVAGARTGGGGGGGGAIVSAGTAPDAAAASTPESVLTHPPRPRKKKRR